MSGSWTHYALTYDNNEVKLYMNGSLVDTLGANGYLNWGDGDDYNLYLGARGVAGWGAKAEIDEVRVYRRAFTQSEILSLYGSGAGDVGIRPLVSGNTPFAINPTSQTITFLDGNTTTFINDLVQSEVNATGGNLLNFSSNSNEYTYDLNVTSPPIIRVAIPHGAVEKDGNYSQAVSYEFHNRIISSVEDGLLGWYDMDEISGGKILDKSGRMRHASLITGDITDDNSDNVEGSPESHDSFPVENAFDNDSTTESGRWLALQSAIPVNAQYNFDTPVHISSYEIVSQNYFEELRSPKAWRLQGSNDNSDWTDLHTVTNETGWGEWEARNYQIPNPEKFKNYKFIFEEANGLDPYLGIAEIKLFPETLLSGKFDKALYLVEGVQLNLPFRIDQGSLSRGFSFSSWMKPDQVIGGYDNERQIFSTDDGGWDWSMSIRYGSLSVWNGNSRIQSGFQVYSNEWYHVVAVFDPILGRTTLHLNGKSVTLDSLGFDNNDDLLTIGWQRDGRTFDGLIDDVRMWGRPIQSDEVLSLWGGGLGDIGPRAKFLFDNPIYGSEINATVVFNQSVSDFNASTDLDLTGMTLKIHHQRLIVTQVFTI